MNTRLFGKAAPVVTGGFLLLFSVMGLVCNCFALSTIPITTSLGLSRGAYGLSQTLLLLFSAVFTLVSRRLFARLDLVRGIRLAALVCTAVFFLQSYATKVWMFYISYSLLGFFMGMATTLPVSLLINEWVSVNANTFIGIAMMGSGIGGAIFNPLLSSLISSRGWQSGYRIMALLMGAIAIPSAFLLMRHSPDAGKAASAAAAKKTRSVPLLQKRVLLFLSSLFMLNGIAAALNFGVNPHVQDIGYPASFASLCSSASMIFMAAGKISVGRIFDRRGTKTAFVYGILGTAAGLASLAFFREPAWLFIVLSNLGLFFGCPFGTVCVVAVTREAVGKDNMSDFAGLFQSVTTLGATLAPLLLGNAYDIFGSYKPLLLALAVLMTAWLPLTLKAFDVPLKTGK